MDDGIRERHGVTTIEGSKEITLVERHLDIETPACLYHRYITPAEARYLARKLYRLARRIDKRSEQQ